MWDKHIPHKHSYDEKTRPANNYCGNPEGSASGVHGPWCFTVNPRERWDGMLNV